jgi:CubicO group peptidase (beta-lactamase class C family)
MDARISAALKKQFDLSYRDEFRDLRAVLVDVCGIPVHEEYRETTPETTYNVFSVTKSFVGTLVGMALADGSLRSLDQTLGELLPKQKSVMSKQVAGITLRELLTMTAGLDADQADVTVGGWVDTQHFVKAILEEGITGTRGTWAYSSATSHLLSAIVAEATGRSVLDYATEKLFEPLGIDTTGAAQPLVEPESAAAYDKASFAWPVDHQGVNFGGGGLKVRPRDMARLGQLYLDGGSWKGKQIVPAAWVREATRGQVAAPGGFGGDHYGYLWWPTAAASLPAFAAIGFGGQLIEVVPAKSLVVVFSTYVDSFGTTPPRVEATTYQTIVSAAVVPAIG